MQTSTSTVLWIIWGLVLLFFIVSSLILSFHWRSYSSVEDKKIQRARRIYYTSAAIILFITAITIVFV